MTLRNFEMKNKLSAGLFCQEKSGFANIKSPISVIVLPSLGTKHCKQAQVQRHHLQGVTSHCNFKLMDKAVLTLY